MLALFFNYCAICLAFIANFAIIPDLNGEVSEWLKEHAWKVCIRS